MDFKTIATQQPVSEYYSSFIPYYPKLKVMDIQLESGQDKWCITYMVQYCQQ